MSLTSIANVLSGNFPSSTLPQIGDVDGPSSSTDNALVRFDGTTGKIIQNGVITEDDYTGTLNGPLNNSTTTAAGSAFTNQPANDGVTIVSANAGDTTQTVTIIGTTNGSDTTVTEVIALTGTTPANSVKTNWGVILAVKKSATTLGTVTVSETSGGLTITAGLTAAVLSVGVTTVTDTAAYNRVVNAVASGATTKQIGFGGTDTSGTQIYDSQALTGATSVTSNSSFFTLTEIYSGDVEASRTVTVTSTGTLVINSGLLQLSGNQLITGTSTLKFGATASSTIGVSADTTAGILQITGPSSGTITLNCSGGTALTLNSNRSTISGVSGAANAVCFGVNGGATNGIYAPAANTLGFSTNSTLALTLDSSQNATFAGTITKPGGTSPLVSTNTTITSGAGAQAGTLLNSPAAGNPTSWIPINDNGTTRYIPAW